MICIYGVNSTGTNWISRIIGEGLRALHALGNDWLNAGPVDDVCHCVVEPFSPGANTRRWNSPDGYTRLVDAHLDLAGRWPGRNEALNAEQKEAVRGLLRAFAAQRPEAGAFKTLAWPYWEEIREVWPETRFVRMTRCLRGFLECIARREKRWTWYKDWWWQSLQGQKPPWVDLADRALREEGFEEYLLPLVRAAYLRHVQEEWREAHQPQDVITTSYEAITGTAYREIWRVLEECGLPRLPEATISNLVMPADQSWRWWTPFGPADVDLIISRLAKRGDCRE